MTPDHQQPLAIPILGNEYRAVAGWSITHAESSVLVATFLFSLGLRDDRELHVRSLVRLLHDAVWRGVDVRVLLSAPEAESQRRSAAIAEEFLRNRGVATRVLRDPAQHLKFMIVDEHTAIIGSHNWTPSALGRNFEASILVKDGTVARDGARLFHELWNRAEVRDAGSSHTTPLGDALTGEGR